MKLSDRRLARRFSLAVPLYFRAWKSQAPEEKVESIDLSERGVYFHTETPISEGAMIQLRLEMPGEVTGQPTNEWRCAGKVVRIHPATESGIVLGVRVRFDYYEISRSSDSFSALAISST